jgi:hypothetical protein
MTEFAARTGLAGPAGSSRRYLWTDAFAVCNFLAVSDDDFELALRLVDRVHHTLGRHRSDDARRGWLSGLGEAEGERHPTRGGLRIGKPLPERRPEEPFDADLEWERDGQYFHYLTKWMHALDRLARTTEREEFNRWARELARSAYHAFSRPLQGRGLAWKMSVDLSRPQVPSMGHHDPLDGLVTFVQLQATAAAFGSTAAGPDLDAEIQGLAAMARGGQWATTDLLGIGGLLVDACRVRQLADRRELDATRLVPELLAAALVGLRHAGLDAELTRPASRRLAFREIGLAIGLHAIELLERLGPGDDPRKEVPTLLEHLRPFVPIAAALESFWLQPLNRGTEHVDIDEVMLATSLAPTGFLVVA